MKRKIGLILPLLLLLPCLLLFAACGGDPVETTENEGPYTVAFVIDGRERCDRHDRSHPVRRELKATRATPHAVMEL